MFVGFEARERNPLFVYKGSFFEIALSSSLSCPHTFTSLWGAWLRFASLWINSWRPDYKVNLPSSVALRPLCHKVNLSRYKARWRRLIMTCDIYGTEINKLNENTEKVNEVSRTHIPLKALMNDSLKSCDNFWEVLCKWIIKLEMPTSVTSLTPRQI